MILVDSSVWVDYLRNTPTWQAEELDRRLDDGSVAVGDLILTEVLQGIGPDTSFDQAYRLLSGLPLIEIAGAEVALQSARNYRILRKRGITVRKTIDGLIATRCIIDRVRLLHRDKDFEPFEQHLGLVGLTRAMH